MFIKKQKLFKKVMIFYFFLDNNNKFILLNSVIIEKSIQIISSTQKSRKIRLLVT